jgi:hypothetical protein
MTCLDASREKLLSPVRNQTLAVQPISRSYGRATSTYLTMPSQCSAEQSSTTIENTDFTFITMRAVP